jgi:glycyl-tRNA synthetase
VQQISKKKAGSTDEPAMIYEAPFVDSGAVRAKNRLLRFICGRQYVLLVQNQAGGSELLVIKLSESDGISGNVILQKRLGTISKAVSLAVCPLSKSVTGEYQTVIAVAGHTGSIELLSLNCSPSKGLSRFLPFVALKAVHSTPTTALAFSNFVPPAMPVTGETKSQSIQLASTSAGGDIVVHTLPLQPYPAKSKNPSYVLASPGKSDVTQAVFSVSMAAVVIALAAFLLQAFSEIRGAVPPTLGAADWLSPQLKQLIYRPYILGNNPITTSDVPVVASVKQKLHEIVAEHASAETPKAIVVRDEGNGELSTEVRHGTEIVHEETLRKWEDLQEHEKEGWKQKLSDAGHWSASQGENVLKGILFSELAGIAGGMVGAA